MVPSIARQSVIIKCNMQKSILTGNYEFYYAAGLAAKLTGRELANDLRPEEVKAALGQITSDYAPQDEKEAYLLQMLAEYRPGEEYDAQMQELLLWGREEQNLWSVTSS